MNTMDVIVGDKVEQREYEVETCVTFPFDKQRGPMLRCVPVLRSNEVMFEEIGGRVHIFKTQE